MERLLIRPKEASEMLGCSRSHLYTLLATGTLPRVRLGKSIRIPLTALRRWIDEQRTEQSGRK